MTTAAGAIVVLGFVVLATAMLAPRHREPISERAVLSMLLLAAWLERVAIAWDAGIVRYRLERLSLVIDMQSTAERHGRRRAA